ncbi:MAG: hypothetical protein V3W34_01010 [Phycisphaerae bacterium]
MTLQSSSQKDRPSISNWERVSFEVTRFVVGILARILSLTGLYHFGRAFATLEWLIQYKRRRRFAARMQELFGTEMSPVAVRRACWRHFVRVRNDKLYYLIFDLLPPEKVLRRFTITNKHLLDDALARGKGAHLAMSHLGSHHVGFFCLRASGYTVAIVRDPKEGAMRRYMRCKHETTWGDQMRYFRNDVFPRTMYRWYENNGLLMTALDVAGRGVEHVKTVEATLFGKRRPILPGPIQLASRCGAPTLQGFVVTRKNFHYEFELHGPLVDPAEDQSTDERLAAAVQAYADGIERFARAYPCHVSRI